MALLDEVKSKLASTSRNSIRKLSILPDSASGFIIRDAYWYGVGIPYDGKVINENFSNARIRTSTFPIEGRNICLLLLECSIEDVRNQFATLCAEFLEPGKDNHNRHALIADPHQWWKKWTDLLGNSIQEKKPYQLLAELLVLERLITSGENAVWQGAAGNTKDIETDSFSCEVKSTIDRYATQITVSSKYQLVPNGKPLKLAFVRFEPSASGDSLSKAVDRLSVLGCSKHKLLSMLERQGVVPGNLAYTATYNLLEMRMYDVDDTFPIISDSSFVGGHTPQNLVSFTYTLDLTGLSYEAL